MTVSEQLRTQLYEHCNELLHTFPETKHITGPSFVGHNRTSCETEYEERLEFDVYAGKPGADGWHQSILVTSNEQLKSHESVVRPTVGVAIGTWAMLRGQIERFHSSVFVNAFRPSAYSGEIVRFLNHKPLPSNPKIELPLEQIHEDGTISRSFILMPNHYDPLFEVGCLFRAVLQTKGILENAYDISGSHPNTWDGSPYARLKDPNNKASIDCIRESLEAGGNDCITLFEVE